MIKLRSDKILNADGYHIGETILTGDSDTFHHTHEFFEVFLITEGEMVHYINDRQVLLRQNTLCLIRPEDKHHFRKGTCKNAHLLNMAFSRELFELAWSTYEGYTSETNRELGIMSHIPAAMSLAIQSKITFLAKNKSSLFPISGKDTLVTILLDCFLVLQNRMENQMAVPSWLEQACQDMRSREHYMQGLPEFVALSGKTQEHLTRSMKKYYHTTPTAYLNRIKLEHAAAMLETTREKILTIMLECGFNNVAYFNQLFKKEYGITPSRYRTVSRAVVNPGESDRVSGT